MVRQRRIIDRKLTHPQDRAKLMFEKTEDNSGRLCSPLLRPGLRKVLLIV